MAGGGGAMMCKGKFVFPVFVSFLILTVFACVSAAKTICVPDNCTSIQQVVHSASEGDTIIVGNGNYYENIYVNTVSKLYTYPCAGTGSHAEYAYIGNKTWNATATWEGYVGDWKNITFDNIEITANKEAEQFKFVSVTLIVKDINGNAIKNAEVKAFSEDWSIKYPHDWGRFNYTNESGYASFEIPVGNWTFFVGGGNEFKWSHPGEGYFTVLNVDISSNSTFEIRPNDTINLTVYDINNQPLDVDDVYLMESTHVPMVPLPICGKTDNGNITIQVTEGLKYDLLLIKRPSSDGEGYILYYKNVASGSNLNVNPAPSTMSHIKFECYDRFNNSTILNIGISLPYVDMDRLHGFFDFNVNGSADMYVTPMFVRINYRNMPHGWYYIFVGKGYNLTAGSDMTLKFGGPVTVDVKVQQQNTQIWLLVRDSFGNILDFFSTPAGDSHIPIKLTRNGSIIYEGELVKWLQGRLDVTYEPENSPQYEIILDLGPSYGVFNLTGTLLSDETAYGYDNITTQHFIVHGPYGFRDKIQEFAETLEAVYPLYEYINNGDLESPIDVYIDICPFSAGWAGTNVFGVWLGGFLHWDSYGIGAGSTIFEGVVFHELGHVFQLSPPNYYFISSWYGEPHATLLGYEAIEYLHGENIGKWHRANHPKFFDYIHREADLDLIENTQFILFYLREKYGMEIHKDFVLLWNGDYKDILFDAGFNDKESVAVLYSHLSRENLAWLFQLAGFDITDERVDEGLKLIFAPELTVSISTDKYEYRAGDVMLINITFENPTDERKSVKFLWRLDISDYNLSFTVINNKSLLLPPEFKKTFVISWRLPKWKASFNASWYVALYDGTISEDTADWRYVGAKKKEEREIAIAEYLREIERSALHA